MNAYEFIIKMKDMASSQLQNVARSLGVAKNELHSFNTGMKTSESTANKLGGTMGKLKGIIAGIFAVGAIWSFTDKVIGARSEYERFETVLTNTFQSAQVGKGALNMLTDFATKTPFALNELTDSFVKLVNRGFNPTKDEMRNLGDLASSQGKGFGQITEALLDAQTGEFERLKEIGITASKHGDKVMMSFKGVNKEVNNNASAISNALLEYGRMPGVAGAMSAESKALGGKINNLKDEWNKFLVAVGGESSGVFTGAISALTVGLSYMSSYLPAVSEWFSILWSMIEPVVTSLGALAKAVFGFNDAGSAMQTFGSIMSWVLVGFDWLTTGITTVIGWLMPFSDVIGVVAGAWAALNIIFAISPLGWIVMAIMAVIAVIGMVVKYTSGWGESWKHTVNGAKFLWQAYTDYVKANFNALVQSLMIGINKIKLGWYEFKEAVGMGDSSQNQKMIAQISAENELRKKSLKDGYLKIADSAMKAKNEFSQVGVKVNWDGASNDWNANQKKLKSAGGVSDTSTKAYDDMLKANKLKGAGAGAGANGLGGGKDKKADSIVSGGSKMTNINITIEKLGTDLTINVDKTERGVERIQEIVRESLLRAVNSVNQMQTS